MASIALQNTVDQNSDTITNGRVAGADSRPEFSGEIAVAQCETGIVNCAPTGTANPTAVGSPRLSSGGFTTDDNRKRFYLGVTGDSTDRE